MSVLDRLHSYRDSQSAGIRRETKALCGDAAAEIERLTCDLEYAQIGLKTLDRSLTDALRELDALLAENEALKHDIERAIANHSADMTNGQEVPTRDDESSTIA